MREHARPERPAVANAPAACSGVASRFAGARWPLALASARMRQRRVPQEPAEAGPTVAPF